MIPLTGLTMDQLQALVAELELPKFTAKQMASWIYQKQIFSIDEMTNLSKAAREKLHEKYTLGRRRPARKVESRDGTIKYLFATSEGGMVETVYIPQDDRATLCVSSEVGCKMGCKFCMTGRQGFDGTLSCADILNQIYSIPKFDKVTNVVFMGQGEPFDNTENVIQACNLLTAPYGLGWSPKRITVSTVGLIPGMRRFLNQSECNLAISLHFSFADQRREWMPSEVAFPIERVVDVLREYDFCRSLEPGEVRMGNHQRKLSFEYILFRGVNDGEQHIRALVRLLKGLDCKVNLIPFHNIPDAPFRGCGEEEMKRFRDNLTRAGIFTTLRASRGQDIQAACDLLNTGQKKPRPSKK